MSSFCVLEPLESRDFADFVTGELESSFEFFGESFGEGFPPLEPLEFSRARGGGRDGGAGLEFIPAAPVIPARRPEASTPGKVIPD